MINSTNIRHGIIALVISAIALLLTLVVEPTYLLCFSGALLFLGREQTHAELRIKSEWGAKEITDAITLESLRIWRWDTDTLMDFLVPLFCGVLLCVTAYFLEV